MTQPNLHGDDVSLLALGTTLLRGRRRILRWMLAGAVVATLLAATRPKLYVASAAFAPQGVDPSRSGLASLAGQFGLAVPATNQTQSTDFYLRLLRSRVLLQQIVQDTFAVPEQGGRRVTFLDLFEIRAQGEAPREELGERALLRLLESSANKSTGVVELSVATKWPSVSRAIVDGMVTGVNDFNKRTRQLQAAAEREFIERRLALAGTELRAAEDRLERFLNTNRVTTAAQLTFERDRLQRAVNLQQQVFTTLTQAYEDVRIREVRDTPVITILEQPQASSLAEPRRRLVMVALGILLGGAIGAALVFMAEVLARRRRAGADDADEFKAAVGEMRDMVLGPVRRLRTRLGSREESGR